MREARSGRAFKGIRGGKRGYVRGGLKKGLVSAAPLGTKDIDEVLGTEGSIGTGNAWVAALTRGRVNLGVNEELQK